MIVNSVNDCVTIPKRIPDPPPELGIDTGEILDSLGYPPEEIAKLRAEGVI